MTTETQTPETRPIEVPLEPTTPIRPSEAIRLGCLLAPVQSFEDLTDGPGTACVLGALYLGYGEPLDGSEDFRVPAAEDARDSVYDLSCPEGCGSLAFQLSTVAHLNDDHRWSRERIADWLEGLGL